MARDDDDDDTEIELLPRAGGRGGSNSRRSRYARWLVRGAPPHAEQLRVVVQVDDHRQVLASYPAGTVSADTASDIDYVVQDHADAVGALQRGVVEWLDTEGASIESRAWRAWPARDADVDQFDGSSQSLVRSVMHQNSQLHQLMLRSNAMVLTEMRSIVTLLVERMTTTEARTEVRDEQLEQLRGRLHELEAELAADTDSRESELVQQALGVLASAMQQPSSTPARRPGGES